MLLPQAELAVREADGIALLLLRGDPFEDAVENRCGVVGDGLMLVLDDGAGIELRVVLR